MARTDSDQDQAQTGYRSITMQGKSTEPKITTNLFKQHVGPLTIFLKYGGGACG
jgi:hypothetical protein